MELGKTDLLLPAIIVMGAIASWSDLRTGKIRNWLTFGSIFVGLSISATLFGPTGILESFSGLGLGLGLYGVLYVAGILGAGDVKLLMAFGAWGGPSFVLQSGLLAILFGGMIAFVFVSRRHGVADTMYKVYLYLLSLFVKEGRSFRPSIDRDSKMPFAVPLALAGLCSAWWGPIHFLGIWV